MSKRLRKVLQQTILMDSNVCCVPNVENFKRSRAAAPFSIIDTDSKLFFDRILSVKKTSDIVFITAAKSRER